MPKDTTIYLGFDPGVTGGIAVLDLGAETPVAVFDPPTLTVRNRRDLQEYEMAAMLAPFAQNGLGAHPRVLAYIEWAQSMPGQGVASTFSYGKGFGIWLGILAAYEIPTTKVRPQTWHAVMLRDHGDRGKNASLAEARRLFPQIDLGRRKDAGRAEALLIAEYGRRVTLGAAQAYAANPF